MPLIRRRRIAICVIAAVLAAALLAHNELSRGIDAALVLADLAAGAGPSPLKSTAPPPERSGVSYRIDGNEHAGDRYRPQRIRAAIVLVPGALATGKDDPRLIAFATTLARAGFDVLVPDLPGVRALELRESDARDIAAAVDYLSETDSGHPLGLAAISYAVGPAIIAALDPAVGGKLRFIVAVGGYYDTDTALTFFTTGYYRDPPGGPWRHRTPNAYGKWLFVKSNLAFLTDPNDRAVLSQMAERKLTDVTSEIGDLAAGLGPEGRAVYDFVENADPAQVPARLAALPKPIRDVVAALDLKTRDLSRLSPLLILIHGKDDVIVPESESVALRAAAAPGRAKLFLIEHLSHVDLKSIDVGDAVTLWRAVYCLLKQRED